jgi:hypothetical protein
VEVYKQTLALQTPRKVLRGEKFAGLTTRKKLDHLPAAGIASREIPSKVLGGPTLTAATLCSHAVEPKLLRLSIENVFAPKPNRVLDEVQEDVFAPKQIRNF